MSRVALGFRVKSGYAVAVALRGPATSPTIATRQVVELSDPAAPETRQPYHHEMFTYETDARAIAKRVDAVERCARASVDALLADAALAGCRRATLVVGSVIDPQSVGNPHIRAHASEGRLFRSVLQTALEARGVACDLVVEKQLRAKASEKLNERPATIARQVARMGKDAGPPWRADEKAASTAAWMTLE